MFKSKKKTETPAPAPAPPPPPQPTPTPAQQLGAVPPSQPQKAESTPAQQQRAPPATALPPPAANGGANGGAAKAANTPSPAPRRDQSPTKGPRRAGEHFKEFSPYAVSLGLTKTPKWGNDKDDWSGSFTDRTHGAKGRPQGKLGKGEGNRPKKVGGEKPKQSVAESFGMPKKRNHDGKYGDYPPSQNFELMPEYEKPPPAPTADLPNFSGNWLCGAVNGQWKEFLEINGVESWKIKCASRPARTACDAFAHAVPCVSCSQRVRVLCVCACVAQTGGGGALRRWPLAAKD